MGQKEQGMVIRYIGWTVFIFCFWCIFVSLYVFYTYTHPPRYISPLTPADYGLKYERVTFTASDGLNLAGWFIQAPNEDAPVIIGCHGYPFDKGNILDLLNFLYPDYSLFLFDFRAMGESEGKVTTAGFHETKDLEAAAGYLKERGIKRIGAIGFSLGAAVIILANTLDIKAIVSDSSFRDLDSVISIIFKHLGPLKWPIVKLLKLWSRLFIGVDTDRVSPLKAIKELKAPILFIHGGADTEIPASHSKQLYEAGVSFGKNVELWVVPDADHGEIYYLNPEEYPKRVKGFFDRFLGLNKPRS